MISTTLSPLVEKLSTLLSAHPAAPVLVALDGRCGSGKTMLAAQLARLFPRASRCIPMTSIFPSQPCGKLGADPLRQHGLGASACPGAHPRQAGQAVPYRAYSCRAGAYLPEQCFAPQPLVIVEGSYSCHPTLADCYDLKVFVTCSRKSRPAACWRGRRTLFRLHRPVDPAGRGVFRKIPDRADR